MLKNRGSPGRFGLSRGRSGDKLKDKPVAQPSRGTVWTAVMAAMLGADILRVHDVAETGGAIKMVTALGQVAM